MKIVIPEFMLDSSVARLAAQHEVLHDATLVDRPAELLQAAADADALIVRNRTQVRGELLAAMQRCKVIGRLGVGLDNIDMDACRERGIHVAPATGANARAVAEYVMTMALLLLRGAFLMSERVASGAWPRAALTGGFEVQGRTLGIVGFGSIGQTTAALARQLGMRVLACDRQGTRGGAAAKPEASAALCSLATLLASSDVVSLHVPLTAETRGLIGTAELAAMRRGAVLINVARGGVVDEAALAQALRSGHLRGAALDVFTDEPLPAGSVLVGVPNLVLTPHIAGMTVESEQRVGNLVADRVLARLAGEAAPRAE
ncbi:hydroxyacid dehydrogenase [Methylibium sp.]|jgi:(S)-sulfolactate dehydrogenase|uniref:hydroxyacid dehydrogenase n=1 Tax=Methylibium sp. TaxID=2067992 RepID=UPI00333E721B